MIRPHFQDTYLSAVNCWKHFFLTLLTSHCAKFQNENLVNFKLMQISSQQLGEKGEVGEKPRVDGIWCKW